MGAASSYSAISGVNMTVRLDDFNDSNCLDFIAENNKWPEIIRGYNPEIGSDLQVFVKKLTIKIYKNQLLNLCDSEGFPKIEKVSVEFEKNKQILFKIGRLFRLIFKTNKISDSSQLYSIKMIDENFFHFISASSSKRKTGHIYYCLFDILRRKNKTFEAVFQAIVDYNKRQALRDNLIIDEKETFESSLKNILSPYMYAAKALRSGLGKEIKDIIDSKSDYKQILSEIQMDYLNKDLFLMRFIRGDFNKKDLRFEWFLEKIKNFNFDQVEDREIVKKIDSFCFDNDLTKKIVLSPSEIRAF